MKQPEPSFVVKLQVYLDARGVPDVLVMPVVKVAVYVVFLERDVEGVNVAVLVVLLYATVPVMLPLLSRNVEVVIVDESMASEKVALMAELGEASVAPLVGTVAVTVGAVP